MRPDCRRTDCSLELNSDSNSMKWAVTPINPRMGLSVQMSTVSEAKSVFCSLDFILASFSAASSLIYLVTVLRLIGQYLSTTDKNILKFGFSTKVREVLDD